MDYALEERIGNPDLFTGRKAELTYYLKWINDIKEKKSQSTAILARRKMGKTALMERLFNITFYKNDGVIPFYFEIKERDVWIVDFCIDFCLTFIYQYIAFKSRKREYLGLFERGNFTRAKQTAVNEGLEYLVELIAGVEDAARNEQVDILWEIVREAPKTLAFRQREFIVQMIDEFQFMNAMIYWDKSKKNLAKNLAGGYLSTAESKVAPLLVSGSWVGWLMNELNSMLPSRFRYKALKNMPENEASEMLYKYSRFFDVPVTEETAYLLGSLTEGSPFYISAVIRSDYPDKDLTTLDGLTRVFEFETLDDQGIIKSTWMEYIKTAFNRVNDRNAKNIVLHLCKHKGQEVTRKELLEKLNLDMSDTALEEKMDALVKADIIRQGRTNFDYQGVQDNIFDKVFRGVYQKEIEYFDVGEIKKEYQAAFEKLKKQYYSLLGKSNYQKGYFAEYLILDQLKYHAREKNELLKSITRHLPPDFDFCDYSIIGEVKSREARKFSKEEAVAFETKFAGVKKLEKINRVVAFIFSRSGFTRDAKTYCQEKGIACSEDERWLDSEKLK